MLLRPLALGRRVSCVNVQSVSRVHVARLTPSASSRFNHPNDSSESRMLQE